MNKIERMLRRKKGIRKKISGTGSKPRICVFKSLRHLYVQAIDDERRVTLAYSWNGSSGVKKNIQGAHTIGEKLAEQLVQKNIKEAVFDRSGYKYHGLVRAVAEGLRKGGIEV